MPYTRTSLVVLCVVILALAVVAGSGAVDGPWRLLLVAVALAAPGVILKDSVLVKVPASERRPEVR
jgi:hypothetical protein